MKIKSILTSLALCLSMPSYAENPVSAQIVEQMIQAASSRLISLLTYVGSNGITVNNNTISLTTTYAVGDIAQGGVIIYVDDTLQHGLAMNLNNAVDNIPFSTTVQGGGAGDYVDVTGQSDGIGGGALNTPAIQGAVAGYRASIGQSGGATGIATWYATLVRQYENGAGCPAETSTGVPVPPQTCLGDFYLPSTNELQIIANNNGVNNYTLINNAIQTAGGTQLSDSATYWTSTTNRFASGQSAFAITNISTGATASADFSEAYTVRPVRRF